MVRRSKRVQIYFILVFFIGVIVFAQNKQVNENKQLREEILTAYQSGGEQGLLDFVRNKKDKISNKFIADFAKAGVKERKEDWLKACEIMSEEKKDEKTLADVLYNTGTYFRLISDYKKAADYFDKALPIYLKLNDPVGQGNVYLGKGHIYWRAGDNSRAFEMYDKALPFFKKAGDPIGQGNVYLYKGRIYRYTGDNSRALEMYEKALLFFEKVGDPIGQGNVYLRKGIIYFYTGDNSRTFEMYDKALPFFEKAGDPIGQANVYLRKGRFYYRIGDYSKAFEMYDKALPFFEKAGDPNGQGYVREYKGDIYWIYGNNTRAHEMYDNALPYYEKAGNPIGQGNVYWGKGTLYYRTGDNSRAFEMYDKALPFFEKVGDPIGQGNVYLRKGLIYFNTDYSKAFEMYDKALSFFEKAGEPIGQGNIYLLKGDIYLYTGDNFSAFEMYDKALPFFEKAGDTIGQGNVYLSKGIIYFYNGDSSRAFEMYDKALPFFEKVGNLLSQGNVYYLKGNSYLYTGDYSRALEMYAKALPFFEKVGDPKGQGNVYKGKGDIYLKTNDNSRALELYEKALDFFTKYGDIKAESSALHRKAKVLVKGGEKEKAMALFEKGIANLEKLRTQTVFSEMKRTFMEDVYEHYQETVMFMIENKYDEKGFKYAESMRTRVFLDQMAEGLVRLDKGLTPELKENRDKRVAKLSLLSKEIYQTAGKKEEKKLLELKEQYRKAEKEFEDLLVKIRLNNPLYASVRYPEPITAQALQTEVLKKGEILVRYFISPDKLYVFLISKDIFKVIPLKLKEKEIKNITGRYLRAVAENISREINRYGKSLYQKLFRPLEASLKNNNTIIIVPDGELAKIPFESLIPDKKGSDQPVYLMEKYRLKYVRSATLLSILRKLYRRDSNTKSFIGFGDPVYDYENFKQGKPEQGTITRSPKKGGEIRGIHSSRYARAGGIMDRLPHSGEEVTSIGQLFKKSAQKWAVHSREQASEDNAKAPEIKDFDFIHFACHGLLNDDFQSLVLSQLPEDKSKEDGYLTLTEIMNCDFNAKLVVLSACQTGSGKMERAEGVTGLTRAVMYAGTPAVVASLWKVDDIATKELMVKFYRNMLEKKMEKTEALRQAKLELLKNKNYRSPLFWSAFVMYGE